MTKSGRAERSKTLFAHAVLASIREEQLAQKHFDTDDDRPNSPEFAPSLTPSPDRLQAEIGKAFKEVEAAENKSVSIENRIRSIPGVPKNLLPKRKYGQPVNGEEVEMTLRSMIEANDPELGAYLGLSTRY